MTIWRPAAFLLLGFAAWAADSAPEFTAAGVARGARPARMVVPGTYLTIYGINLGPAPGECAADVPPAPYPVEICGAQVLIGGTPAPLLFVSDKQINLKVPEDSPAAGTVDIRVVYNGQSSLPVVLPAGFEKTTVSLDGPAYAGMPVWLKVDLPSELEGSIRYPSGQGPAGFGCNEVEMRRDGQTLPLRPESDWYRYGATFSGFICGSYAPGGRGGRLPLHLLYRLDGPGTYQVRYTLRTMPVGVTGQTEFRARSEWTAVEILPAAPDRRAAWLRDLRLRAPSDPAELLSDILPSLLAVPDDASLEMLVGYLYHPDQGVRNYALDGLFYWPDDTVSRRLHALLRSRGPNEDVARYLSRMAAAK